MFKFIVLPILSSVLLAAHFSRVQQNLLALLFLLFPLLFLIKRKWIIRIFQIYLVFGGIVWIERLLYLRTIRISHGQAWIRLAVILGPVALLTLVSAVILQNKNLLSQYEHMKEGAVIPYLPSLTAFFTTASLLIAVQIQVNPPILLLERFFPGSFGIEILGLSLYAAFITEMMIVSKESSRLRGRIWLLFSFVFFGQFLLGLAGVEKFLMTGELHLPIPAMIIAGPLFRGHSYFMLILFTATVLVAGSAWCSHLCYVGSWDNSSSRTKRRPGSLPNWWKVLRYGIFAGVVLTALFFRFQGIRTGIATGFAVAYGVFGVGMMIFVSRKNGVMTHCSIYCPVGLAADILGKLSLFRIGFNPKCDDCGACRLSCRYQALESKDILRKKTGLSCTLCGDCLTACPKSALEYKFLSLSPQTARRVFIALIVTVHAVFLGVARL